MTTRNPRQPRRAIGTPQTPSLALAAAIAALLAGGVLSGCRSQPAATQPAAPTPSPSQTERPPITHTNLVLITVDALRADRMGCYGAQRTVTRNLDTLASGGVLFENCITASPLTAPSVASILTGTYPPGHGCRLNGQPLTLDNLTVTEVLKSAGYVTGAVTGSYLLAGQFGLPQGFDTYADVAAIAPPDVTENNPDWRQRWERPATEVSDLAVSFLNSSRDQKFFLFLHYADPAADYDPPARFRAQYESAYLGELAFVDEQIARVLIEIQRLGLEPHTLVVVVGCQGEGLGDHGESTHGYFLYDTTMRVPLIMRHPTKLPVGKRVADLVRTVDIAPTLLELLALGTLADADGASLVSLVRSQPESQPRLAYGETLAPYFVLGYAPLWMLREGSLKYIHAPEPELYDLAADPREQHNLAREQPQRVAVFRRRLEEMLAAKGPFRFAPIDVLSPDDRERLALLDALPRDLHGPGTITSETEMLRQSGPDPKTRAEAIAAREDAARAMSRGDAREAETHLRRLISVEPTAYAYNALSVALLRQQRPDDAIDALQEGIEKLPDAVALRVVLARLLEGAGRSEEARAQLEEIVRRDPQAAAIHAELAALAASAGDWKTAIQHYRRALDVEPEALGPADSPILRALRHIDRAAVARAFAEALVRAGQYEEALTQYNKLLSANPDDSALELAVAMLYQQQGRWDDARKHLEQAARLDPTSAQPLYRLALIDARDDLDLAIAHLRDALQRDPEHRDSRLLLGQLLVVQRKFDEGYAEYEKLHRKYPEDTSVLHRMANVRALQGRPEDARRLYEQVLAMRPDDAPAHWKLGNILLNLGDEEGALQHYRQAAELAPTRFEPIYSLARLLARRGDHQAARNRFEDALMLQPDSIVALNSLAWLLATSPDPQVRSGQRAVELARQALDRAGSETPELLDTLAAAYAEAGLFDDAIDTAQRALQLARATPGREALAAEIEQRLDLYRRHQPYHAPPAVPQTQPATTQPAAP